MTRHFDVGAAASWAALPGSQNGSKWMSLTKMAGTGAGRGAPWANAATAPTAVNSAMARRTSRTISDASSVSAIGRAEDMGVRWQHHFIERLREHGRGEESHRAQSVATHIDQVVPHVRRKREDTAGSHRMLAVFHEQFARAGKNVLRLLGSIGMPTEMLARFYLVNDGRGLRRATPSAGCEGAGPMDRLVLGSLNMSAIELLRGNDLHHHHPLFRYLESLRQIAEA